MEKYCCDKFLEESNIKAFAGGGFAYPPGMHPTEQIEFIAKTGKWNVNGCCGGGCYVLTDLEYCPWCGKKISVLVKS
jgi:hypothetical protein